MSLERINPETALEMYLADKQNELADASVKAHEYRIGHFVRWCDTKEITNLNTITGRKLHEYRLWRREEGDLNKVTEKTQMDTIRVFVRWLESIDAVEQDLSEKVRSPSITPDENSGDVMLDTERARRILTYLEKYQYCSIQHVTFSLMWHTMMRVGGVHALDVEDYNAGDQFIEVRHRPETGTPIKNKGHGERLVALSERLCNLLDDWVGDKRPDVTDDSGRNPSICAPSSRCRLAGAETKLAGNNFGYSFSCGSGDKHHRVKNIFSLILIYESVTFWLMNTRTIFSTPASTSPATIRKDVQDIENRFSTKTLFLSAIRS